MSFCQGGNEAQAESRPRRSTEPHAEDAAGTQEEPLGSEVLHIAYGLVGIRRRGERDFPNGTDLAFVHKPRYTLQFYGASPRPFSSLAGRGGISTTNLDYADPLLDTASAYAGVYGGGTGTTTAAGMVDPALRDTAIAAAFETEDARNRYLASRRFVGVRQLSLAQSTRSREG